MQRTSLRDPLARTRRLAALVVPLLAVGACSSGGSGGTPSSDPASTPTASANGAAPAGGAGMTAPVTTRGSLADGGGLVVDGTSYDSTDTVYMSGGLPVTRDQLAPGMQVSVSSDGGSASMVEYDDDVSGPVDIVNLDGSLSVLGQSVTLAPGANVTLPASGTFTAGDVVEVSGTRTADGGIEATYVALENEPEDYEVRGTVANLDPAAMTFTLGGLTVDYTGAMLSGFAAAGPANGDAVEVSDPTLTYEPGSFNLAVADVELVGTETNDDGIEDGLDDGETNDDGIEDGLNDGETNDDGIEDGLDDGETNDDGIEDGLNDGETNDDGVEDGLNDGETADDGPDQGTAGALDTQGGVGSTLI